MNKFQYFATKKITKKIDQKIFIIVTGIEWVLNVNLLYHMQMNEYLDKI
jgi:hypothetical protein